MTDTPDTFVFDEDLPCLTCGYNLRGLRPDGICPECGSTIDPATYKPPLFDSDPRWRRRIARTIALLPLASVLWAAGILILTVLTTSLRSPDPNARANENNVLFAILGPRPFAVLAAMMEWHEPGTRTIVALAALAAAHLFLAWQLAASDPARGMHFSGPLLRSVVICYAGLIAAILLARLSNSVNIGTELIRRDRFALFGIDVVYVSLFFLRFVYLARRAGRWAAQRVAIVLTAVWPALVVLFGIEVMFQHQLGRLSGFMAFAVGILGLSAIPVSFFFVLTFRERWLSAVSKAAAVRGTAIAQPAVAAPGPIAESGIVQR